MHFGENQLSRSLIALSPLPPTHPPGFHPRWVRASTTSYSRFTLAMGRSLRFGSTPRDYTPTLRRNGCRLRPVRTRFRSRYPPRVNLATERDSQAHSSKGTPSPPPPQANLTVEASALTACRHTVSGTLSLPSRGTFPPSLTVLSAIGHQGVFRLTGWSRQIHSTFHERAATRES